MSSVKDKILLLLLGGLAFGFCYTPQKQWTVIKKVGKEWKRINKTDLHKGINNLYTLNLIGKKKKPDGSYTLFLTERGKIKAITRHLKNIDISSKNWDKKWRIVIFDIPEEIRKGRDALRSKIKEIGFHELQKSVFVFPYECKEEIDFIVNFFKLNKYVHYGVLESINNEKHIKEMFNLK